MPSLYSAKDQPRSLPGRSPFSCATLLRLYPVSGLPDSLQLIALALPTTHVFEDALQRAGERHAGAIG